MIKELMFMGNGDYRNKGCEAITRGTVEILNNAMPNASFVDSYFLYDEVVDIEGLHTAMLTAPVEWPKKWSFWWWCLQIAIKVSLKLTGEILYGKSKKYVKNCSAVLSLGGDNYSLDYGIPKRFISMSYFIKKRNTPFVIWGASIGPFSGAPTFEKKLIENLRKYVDLIFVREEDSYNYLVEKGLKSKAYLMADPAFVMQPEKCSSEQIGFLLPKTFISVNFSPLMAKYVTNGNISEWKNICRDAVDQLIKNYNLPIVLVPHVFEDIEFMKETLSSFIKNNSNINIVDFKINAAQMKWIISKSKINIAARTHATIASFSTCVPTLSLGYSIKAIGLNKLIFGNLDYLLYGEEISANNILDKVSLIIDNEEKIRKTLAEKNVDMKMKAQNAGFILSKYLS